MSHDPRCPSCGHLNDPETAACSQCNFPLREVPGLGAVEPAGAGPAPGEAPAPVRDPAIRPFRPIRPRPPRPPHETQQAQLWLWLGGIAGLIAVAMLLATAYQGFRKNNRVAPVEGAKEAQQQAAEAARAAIARDSTNVNAHVALANVLYDTANWADAVVEYEIAARLDSTRVETFVDEGVCWFNLSHPDEAAALFKKALTLDPHQSVALFNLGIVSEHENRFEEALKYYHQAMQGPVPDTMQKPLMEAMQRVMQKLGRRAPAIPGVAGSSGSPPN